MHAPFKSQFVKTKDVQLHLISAGPQNGPVILFLHGFPEFWYAWRKQIEHFAALGFWVLVPDQRGYNLSEKPESIPSYSVDKLAQDILDIMAWSGRKQATIVGHDWGAAVAWHLGIHHPASLDKLVILNVPHPQVMRKNLLGNFKQMMKSWYIFFFQLPKIPEWFLLRKRQRALAGSLRGSSRAGTFTKEDIAKYREAWTQKGAVSGMVNWYRAALRRPAKAKEPQTVSVPTLMIWGEKDEFLGKEMATQSIQYCSAGQLEFIATASHWVQHEEAERVNSLIQNFVGRPNS
jgi:pimeloyl-ACP methyl ester carboxylesterase